ncbi:MAG: FAD-binding oxidoreductase [Nanoarchaeota archaeon]
MKEKSFIVKILEVEDITHDVKRFKVEKPKGYKFTPGQATEVSINKDGWKDKKRPFTFTSLNESPNLEFTIKIYEGHNGVTKELGKLKAGDSLIIRDVWGALRYKGEGVFIAGGAGITPFIAILRQLKKENKLRGNTLIFSNKTEEDIILKEELDSMDDLKKIYTLTRENKIDYEYGRVDEKFLKEYILDFSQHFYICGPIRMVGEIQYIFQKLGAESDSIVVET